MSGSEAQERVLRTTGRVRDAAVVLASAGAALVQGVAGLWVSLSVAVAAGIVWILVRRLDAARRLFEGNASRTGFVVQACFVVIGFFLVWRLSFRLLPFALGGMWLLVCAADLDRLAAHFPVSSSPRIARELLRRHLRLLGLIALVGATGAALALAVAVELRLVAVMLIASFVVVVIVRIARDLARVSSTLDDEEP